MVGRSAASRLSNAGIAAATATSFSVFMLQKPLAAENVMNTSDLIATLKGQGGSIAGAGPPAPPVKDQQPTVRGGGDAPRTSAGNQCFCARKKGWLLGLVASAGC
jgi:hypothetical protein